MKTRTRQLRCNVTAASYGAVALWITACAGDNFAPAPRGGAGTAGAGASAGSAGAVGGGASGGASAGASSGNAGTSAGQGAASGDGGSSSGAGGSSSGAGGDESSGAGGSGGDAGSSMGGDGGSGLAGSGGKSGGAGGKPIGGSGGSAGTGAKAGSGGVGNAAGTTGMAGVGGVAGFGGSVGGTGATGGDGGTGATAGSGGTGGTGGSGGDAGTGAMGGSSGTGGNACTGVPTFADACGGEADCLKGLHRVGCCSWEIRGVAKSAKGAFAIAEEASRACITGCGDACIVQTLTADDGQDATTGHVVLTCAAGKCQTSILPRKCNDPRSGFDTSCTTSADCDFRIGQAGCCDEKAIGLHVSQTTAFEAAEAFYAGCTTGICGCIPSETKTDKGSVMIGSPIEAFCDGGQCRTRPLL